MIWFERLLNLTLAMGLLLGIAIVVAFVLEFLPDPYETRERKTKERMDEHPRQ